MTQMEIADLFRLMGETLGFIERGFWTGHSNPDLATDDERAWMKKARYAGATIKLILDTPPGH